MKIKEGITEVRRLIDSYIDLIKLRTHKRGIEIGSRITYGLFTIALIIIGFTFLCVALALFIGELLGSYSLGFLIAGGVPILTIILMQIFKKGTHHFLLNFFTKITTRK